MPRIRLRRSDPSRPGLTRRRYGRGFRYIDADGAPVTDPAVLERIRALAIPPAWRDVWICPDERGHIQAIGTDAAGRRQYRYHDAWRETRDAAKHDRVLEVAQRLPALRKTVERHLARPTLDRERVLATAVRLLDLGMFRIGSESYAEQNGTYGLATLRREHVCLRRGRIAFCYPAKSGQQRVVEIEDAKVRPVLAALRRIQHDGDELLAYRCGRQWCDVRSNEINDYLKEVSGGVEITAKDFRTWHATVLMAVHLALGPPAETERARRKVVRAALEEVAHYLGNTPAVAEASYVDPRIVTLYEQGQTIRPTLDRLGISDTVPESVQPTIERAVLRLLRTNGSGNSANRHASPRSDGTATRSTRNSRAGHRPRRGVARSRDGRSVTNLTAAPAARPDR